MDSTLQYINEAIHLISELRKFRIIETDKLRMAIQAAEGYTSLLDEVLHSLQNAKQSTMDVGVDILMHAGRNRK